MTQRRRWSLGAGIVVLLMGGLWWIQSTEANITMGGGNTNLSSGFSGILPTANGGTGIAYFTAAGPTAARIYTFPDAAATVARTDAAQTFSGIQTFNGSSTVLNDVATGNTVLKLNGANHGRVELNDEGATTNYRVYQFISDGNNFEVRRTNDVASAVLATPFSINNDHVVLGLSAPATTATVGFPQLPVMAGTPTGVPTAITGFSPYVYDSTGQRQWIYDFVAAAWKALVGPATTDTFTNKTYNAESTGNVLTVPAKAWYAAAGCNNATATTLWDLPTTNPGAAACITGTNTQKGVLDFDAATDESVQTHVMLPADWTGNVDVLIKWLAAATSGDVVWAVQTICVADAETDDPAFNTASTVTDTAKGTTLQTNDAAITTVTVTGCAAGELLHLKLSRDADNAADTMTGDARFIGMEVTMRRAI